VIRAHDFWELVVDRKGGGGLKRKRFDLDLRVESLEALKG